MTTAPPKTKDILLAVESATGVPVSAMLADNRLHATSYARFLAMRIFAETHPWASHLDAAKAVGKKDPSTGRHGLMRSEYLMENDAAFRLAHKRAMEILSE
jgi:chromosomal replication initiation ATPase DnaA